MRKLVIGIVVGVLVLGTARLLLAPLNKVTHHHANWLITVDGAPVDLSGDRFMEEIAACSGSDEGILPSQRIHMHEGEDAIVHVHHTGATWGHLMMNLGLAIGDDYMMLGPGPVEGMDSAPPDGRFFESREDEHRLVFILNGFAVPTIQNRVVDSEDRLLVAWTDQPVDAVMAELYPSVASNAGQYNEMMDPASCSGGHGDLPFLERLKLAFWG